ncbi:MAG: glycosyltransferase [Flavobacteriales bacterium]|nr:glycosyltransferase [Flavobacteriales bacterium]
MRVLLIAAASSVHTVRWANAFVQRGLQVHLISQHAPLPALSPSVALHRFPHRGGLGYLLNRRRAARLVRSIRPDVVNAHYASGYGSLVRGLKEVPVVLNVWGSDVYEFPDRSALHRWWLLRNLRAAHRIVSTGHAMAQRVKALLPGAAPVDVVPFGVDLDVFRPADRRGNDPVAIGTVKALAHTYGVDRLLQAFALLLRMDGLPEARLRIVGDGPQRAELERIATGLGIAEQVDFIGAVPHGQVPDALRKLDIYVALSRAESFGVAVIEASACALPVVVSDAGGLPEVVRDGDTGFVVPQGDPAVAAQRLHQLILDGVLRERMGAAGRRWVREQYEWSHCVDRMIAVLQQAAGT